MYLHYLRLYFRYFFQYQNRRFSKLEKADILEMAVQYMRVLHGGSKGMTNCMILPCLHKLNFVSAFLKSVVIHLSGLLLYIKILTINILQTRLLFSAPRTIDIAIAIFL